LGIQYFNLLLQFEFDVLPIRKIDLKDHEPPGKDCHQSPEE
jgi:hypothetical protein